MEDSVRSFMLTHARRLGPNKDSSDSQDEKPRKKLHDIPRLRYTRKKSMKNTTRGSSSDSETNSDKYSYELSAFTQMKKRPYAKKREMVETCFDSASNRKRATSAPGKILSSGSNDDGSDSLTISLTSTNSKSWYSGIMESLVDSISGFAHQVLPLSEKTEVEKTGCDTDYDGDFEGTVDEMTKKILLRITEFCPEQHREDLQKCFIGPLIHKMDQSCVTFGICGQPTAGKKTLMKIIGKTASLVGGGAEGGGSKISYRLCPQPYVPISEDQVPHIVSREPLPSVIQDLITCSGYICVLSCDQLDTEMDISALQTLVERDKDLINQRRVLILANKLDTCFTNIMDSRSIETSPHSTFNNSSPASNEYPYYRLRDREDYEAIIKQRTQKYIQEKIGISVPDSFIHPCMLEWTYVARQQYEDGEDCDKRRQQLISWKELYEPYGELVKTGEKKNYGKDLEEAEDDEGKEDVGKLIEQISGIASIEEWIKDHCQNCERLYELSVISDTIHCLTYCTDKLQYHLEKEIRDTEKLEENIIQKDQLSIEIDRICRHLEMSCKDAEVLDTLMSNYDEDIESSVLTIRESADSKLKEFKSMCLLKLEKLLLYKEEWDKDSIESVLEMFKPDIEKYSKETTRQVGMILRKVIFPRMHSTILSKNKFDEIKELMRLCQLYLSRDDSLAIEEKEIIHPCSLETMACDTEIGRRSAVQLNSHFYTFLFLLSAETLPNHPISKEDAKANLDDSREGFLDQCSKCLTSDAVKRKTVQYHMDIVTTSVHKHLEFFNQYYKPRLKRRRHKMKKEVTVHEKKKNILEDSLRHLINLKVHLEVKKSLYSHCTMSCE